MLDQPKQNLAQSSQSLEREPLSSKYELLEKIGEGGMGSLHRARQLSTNRIVAIKFLTGHYSKDDPRRQRFLQEVAAISKFFHPNLVSVVDSGEDELGRLYLVQDFIPGITLSEVLREKQRLEPYEILEIFGQICKGLGHVHSKGVVHRDIKPSNVMVVREESGDLQVKIVDFGIAKPQQSQSVTQTGEVVGSPLYMSPEQAVGQKIDARSDIYSVGCMLFEAVTGSPPFLGENPIQTLCLRITQDPPSMVDVAPYATAVAQFDKIVTRALKRDMAERYQTISAMQADLMEIGRDHQKPLPANQSMRHLRTQPIAQPTKEAPSWLSTGALVTMIALAISGIGAIGYWAYNVQKDRTEKTPHAVAITVPGEVVSAPAKPESTNSKAPEPKQPVTPESATVPTKVKAKAPTKITPKKVIALPPEIQEDIDRTRQAAPALPPQSGPFQGRPPQGRPPQYGPGQGPLLPPEQMFPGDPNVSRGQDSRGENFEIISQVRRQLVATRPMEPSHEKLRKIQKLIDYLEANGKTQFLIYQEALKAKENVINRLKHKDASGQNGPRQNGQRQNGPRQNGPRQNGPSQDVPPTHTTGIQNY